MALEAAKGSKHIKQVVVMTEVDEAGQAKKHKVETVEKEKELVGVNGGGR